MRKKGFTLIELLAVIVILAIIALIAVPIVLNIINDSKNSSDEQSVELYIDTVKKSISRSQLNDPNFNPKECKIQNSGNLLCDDIEVSVDMKSVKPNSGQITIDNNRIYYRGLKLNSKSYNNVVKLVRDSDNDGKLSVGDKYEYQVNGSKIFNFYVLSIDENSVNLIMDRNICEDGTFNYTSANNYCRYAWSDHTNLNLLGPKTAMEKLYKATKNWINVPDMDFLGEGVYFDEGYMTDSRYGYKKIEILETGINIVEQNGITTKLILYENGKKLKARLSKYSEMSQCNIGVGCPVWLMENLKYYNTNNDKYSMNNNNETYQQIHGYWLLDSTPGNRYNVRYIDHTGHIANISAGGDSYGIRPVITVPIEYLE